MNDEGLINEALRIALRSTIHRFMTGAVLIDRNGVVSVGWSHLNSIGYTMVRSCHAEHHALLRCGPDEAVGATAYVANISRKSGNVTNAMPCANCLDRLRRRGVERVVYTVPGGYDTIYPADYPEEVILDCRTRSVGRKASYFDGR